MNGLNLLETHGSRSYYVFVRVAEPEDDPSVRITTPDRPAEQGGRFDGSISLVSLADCGMRMRGGGNPVRGG